MRSTTFCDIMLHSFYSVLHFDADDDVGSTFLQNVYGLLLDYMTLYPIRQDVHSHHCENLKLKEFNNLTFITYALSEIFFCTQYLIINNNSI
jgi:hypothetical protein